MAELEVSSKPQLSRHVRQQQTGFRQEFLTDAAACPKCDVFNVLLENAIYDMVILDQ